MQNRGERRQSSSRSFHDTLPSRPSRRRTSRIRQPEIEEQPPKGYESIVRPEKASSQVSSSKLPKGESSRQSAAADESTSDEDDEKTFISIGIDLGTTFSGIAWALSTSPTDISIVSSWPAHLPANSCQHKVPSALTYDRDGNVASWGYKLESGKHHIEWFKLGLSKEATKKIAADQPEKHDKLQRLLKHKQKDAVDAVADFLRCLWTHAIKEIKRSVVKGVWDNVDLKIVLTVPAIWDHAAQDLTRTAAKMAGLLDRPNTTLELVGEPEAAALSVFDEMKRKRQRKLRIEDSFVVCDAGGGTVDLISYCIEELDSLRLSMCTEATGDFCGATFVDGSFLRHIRTMMSVEDFSKLDDRQRRKMLNDWECAKRQFRLDSSEDERWYIDVPGYLGREVPIPAAAEDQLPAGFISSSSSLRPPADSILRMHSPSELSLRSDPGAVVLETHHIHAIFNESCSKIKSLVGDQVLAVTDREKKRPTAVLLVGGFGENVFLKQELEHEFPDIEIQQPLKAWAAICRGAVMKGLGSDVVVNHIAKYNYGTNVTEDFIPTVHSEADREIHPIRLVPIVQNSGDNVEKDTPTTHTFFHSVRRPEDVKEKTLRLFYSPSLIKETRLEPSVKPLCQLIMSFDPKIYDELPIHQNKAGEEYRKLHFSLEMQVSSGEICWKTRYKGVETGSVKTIMGTEDY